MGGPLKARLANPDETKEVNFPLFSAISTLHRSSSALIFHRSLYSTLRFDELVDSMAFSAIALVVTGIMVLQFSFGAHDFLYVFLEVVAVESDRASLNRIRVVSVSRK